MQKYHIQLIHPATDEIPEQLERNDNYLIVRIGDNWFSYTQKGESIYFHLFSKNPKTLSYSCELFINWLFNEYEWCKMLLVTINRKSLIKLALKHNFVIVETNKDSAFLARYR